VDNNPNVGAVDVVQNLEEFPWPFEDSSVGEVVMDHVLEHLEDTIGVIQELYRICADQARLHIRTPHFSCNWTHPGHKRAIGVGLFDHFDPANPEHYGHCRFQVERLRLHWMRPRYRTSWARRVVSAAIDWLANRHPRLCQRLWCYWVGGFDEIDFQVRVLKPGRMGAEP
jgi:SAM-dependent methyltransferase